ncbi:MAG: TVP38/TMEM64 family protein [Akkermansiaceae bacterium]|nr:TVP38/TMEM64 family protein [Akkermansiaceae bacterium]
MFPPLAILMNIFHDWLVAFDEWVTRWVADQGVWAPVMFALAYIGAGLALIPGSLLTISAGALFGLVEGTIVVSLASTATAAIAFLLGRFAFRKRIERKLADKPKFKAMDEAIGREGWKIVFLLRLSPIFPYSILNYSLGLTRIGFWPTVWASWAGMLPGTILYVWIGSLAQVATEETSMAKNILYGVGLLATLIVTVWITRIARRSLSGKLDTEKYRDEEESSEEEKDSHD